MTQAYEPAVSCITGSRRLPMVLNGRQAFARSFVQYTFTQRIQHAIVDMCLDGSGQPLVEKLITRLVLLVLFFQVCHAEEFRQSTSKLGPTAQGKDEGKCKGKGSQ